MTQLQSDCRLTSLKGWALSMVLQSHYGNRSVSQPASPPASQQEASSASAQQRCTTAAVQTEPEHIHPSAKDVLEGSLSSRAVWRKGHRSRGQVLEEGRAPVFLTRHIKRGGGGKARRRRGPAAGVELSERGSTSGATCLRSTHARRPPGHQSSPRHRRPPLGDTKSSDCGEGLNVRQESGSMDLVIP
ncbi:unnamed protein product [Gadus morhua 'NCC']